jgi:hypothetical protein
LKQLSFLQPSEDRLQLVKGWASPISQFQTVDAASWLTDFQWRPRLAIRYHFTLGRKRKFF